MWRKGMIPYAMKAFVFILFSFFVAVLAILDRHYFKASGSFCLNRCTPKWERIESTPTKPPPNLRHILNQTFTYLDKGEQSFVFESKDKQWVIKLPRLPRYAKRVSFRRKKRSLSHLQTLVANFKYAYEDLPEATQVIYAHLEQTDFFRQTITLLDPLGVPHHASADDTPFLIQRKGRIFSSYFTTLSNIEKKKELILKTLQLFDTLYDRGFSDTDQNYATNFGVYDEAPFLLDFGHLIKKPIALSKSDFLFENTRRITEYFESNEELLSFYKNSLRSFHHSSTIEISIVR